MRTVMFIRFFSWLFGPFNKPVGGGAKVAAKPADADGVAAPTAWDVPVTVSDGARHLMLAARLASVAKLNAPAGRIKRPHAANSSAAVPTSRIGAAKQRRSSVSRRMARPATSRSAEVIPFPAARHASTAAVGATQRAA